MATPYHLRSYLYLSSSPGRGLGVHTRRAIAAGTVVETAPVLRMSPEDRILLDKTRLYNYIFLWGDDETECAMALGWVSLYNHAVGSNCGYAMDYDKDFIQVIAVRDIAKGEELFINYHGDPDSEEKVWFEAM